MATETLKRICLRSEKKIEMISKLLSDGDIAFVLDAHKDVFEDTEDAEDTEDTDETITPIDLGYSLIGEVIFHRKGYKLECQ